MSTALIRRQLDPIARRTLSANAGLLLSRGFAEVDEQRPELKQDHISRIAGINSDELYRQAFDRWLNLTSDIERFHSFGMMTTSRMLIGLGNATALETAVTTHHTYGMPMVPGSSLKGVAHHYAKAIGAPQEYLDILFGTSPEEANANDDTSSTPGATAGCLVWHDAWWNPGATNNPFVSEVVTPHHQAYYNAKGDATDFDSPIPCSQIAVQGSFLFVIEGDPAWAGLAAGVLKQALETRGVGGKGAAGYGLFETDRRLEKVIADAIADTTEDSMSSEEIIRNRLKEMDEDALLAAFGTKRNSTLDNWAEDPRIDPDQLVLIPQIGLEIHRHIIESWGSETKRSHKEKFKAYKYFTGS